jgi:hypothetical protein
MYTVGHTESYEQLFGENCNTPFKLGIDPTQNYQGGIVFETVEDAQAYLDLKGFDTYSVYGLETDARNRHVVPGEDFWRIKESVVLVKLAQEPLAA